MRTRSILFAIMPLLVAGCAKELTPEINQNDPIAEPVVQKEEAPLTILSATLDDPDTRTYLDLHENGAKVHWEKGDQFNAYIPTGETTYKVMTFTTQDEDVSRATFTSPDAIPDGELGNCTAIYPSSVTFVPSIGARMYVPSTQNAVKEGIEAGLNMAYASLTSLDEDLRFKNVLALFQFRITGTAASRVTSVRLVTTSTIAGDGMLKGLADEEPTYSMNNFYVPRIEEATNTIILNGPFEPDVDYIIATVPCTTNGFSLVFLDEDGNYLVKQDHQYRRRHCERVR